ncbi:MAG: heavy-metal-associated domain-containing protein [Bacteroidetes bacterium]|nr:heavy-metal-associated domain-containing protein [Bacteroidota bacterium]
MEKVIVVAPDISCEHCAMTIKRALNRVRGVHAVNVDVPTKKVTVDYDSAVVDSTAIEAALAEEGYPPAKS